MVAVAALGAVALLPLRPHGVHGGRLRRILPTVLVEKLLLQLPGEGANRVSRLFLPGLSLYGHPAIDCQHAFAADKPEAACLARAVDKVDSQSEVERRHPAPRRVVVQPDHHVRHIAPVLPVTQCPGGVDAAGARRARDKVHPAEQMDEQVARHACAVVLVVPPAEQADGVKRPLRRRAQKPIPVDVGRGGIRRNRVLPGPDGRVAIPPRLHQIQLADRARGQQFLGLGVDDARNALRSHLQNPPALPGGLHQPDAVFHLLHHRLFDVDILAGGQRFGGDPGVPVVRRCDDHRIDVLAREHLAVVARGEQMVAEALLSPVEPPLVNVRGRDHIGQTRSQGRLGVSGPHASDPDGGKSDAVVRSNL